MRMDTRQWHQHALVLSEWLIEWRHICIQGLLVLGTLLLWRQGNHGAALGCLALLLLLVVPTVRTWAVLAALG